MRFTVSKDKHLRTDLKIVCRISVEGIAQILLYRLGVHASAVLHDEKITDDQVKTDFLKSIKKLTQKQIAEQCQIYVLDCGRDVSGERLEDLGYLSQSQSATYEDLLPDIITILKKRFKLTY